MKDLLKKVDAYTDRLMAAYNYAALERMLQYSGSIILIALITLCTMHFVVRAPQWQVSVVQTDLHRIASALRALDTDCYITDMRVGLHPVSVLTRRSLADGPFYIELKESKNWKGPYLKNSPTLQDKPYQLLKTNKSLFVVPGEGVELPSGLVVGTDIEWHADTDVTALTRSGGSLFYKSGPVALEVVYGQGARKQSRGLLPKAARQLSSWIAEFNQAMPFAEAQHTRMLV